MPPIAARLSWLALHTARKNWKLDIREIKVFYSPAEEHGVFVKQPGGKATKLPFSADVRSGPEDCQHVLLLDHLDEGGQIEEG